MQFSHIAVTTALAVHRFFFGKKICRGGVISVPILGEVYVIAITQRSHSRETFSRNALSKYITTVALRK